jgi:DNA-binding transcriptional ArsR family regulator
MTPEDWQDEDLGSLPLAVRFTYLGLKMFADDQGRESATAARIRAALYTLDETVTDETIDEHLVMLADAGLITLYVVGARTYFAIEEWPRVDQAKPSRIPEPPIRTTSGSRPDDVAVVGEEGREEREAPGEPGATSGSPLEPSPFCSKHPDGTEQPCGGCGTARKRHELWVRRQRQGPPRFEPSEQEVDDEPF